MLPQAGLVLEVFAAIFAGALKSFLRHSPNFFKRLCAGCVPIFRLIRQLLESPLDRQRCTLFRKYTTNLVSIQIAVTTKCLSASAPPFCARFFKMLFAHVTVTLKRPGERFATQAAQDVDTVGPFLMVQQAAFAHKRRRIAEVADKSLPVIFFYVLFQLFFRITVRIALMALIAATRLIVDALIRSFKLFAASFALHGPLANV